MAEAGVTPEGRRERGGVAQKAGVLDVRDLAGGEEKFVNPDAVYGFFVVLAGVTAHEEPAGWDGNEVGGDIPGDRLRRHCRS